MTDLTQITSAFSSLKTADNNKLVQLQVQPDGFNLKPLKSQIRKFFEWEFSPDGTSRSRELTGSGEWTMQQVFEQKTSKTKGRIEEEEEEEE